MDLNISIPRVFTLYYKIYKWHCISIVLVWEMGSPQSFSVQKAVIIRLLCFPLDEKISQGCVSWNVLVFTLCVLYSRKVTLSVFFSL